MRISSSSSSSWLRFIFLLRCFQFGKLFFSQRHLCSFLAILFSSANFSLFVPKLYFHFSTTILFQRLPSLLINTCSRRWNKIFYSVTTLHLFKKKENLGKNNKMGWGSPKKKKGSFFLKLVTKMYFILVSISFRFWIVKKKSIA